LSPIIAVLPYGADIWTLAKKCKEYLTDGKTECVYCPLEEHNGK